MFRRATHRVGGLDYSLDVIEHGLLRGNRRPPYGLRRLLSPSDPRLEAAPSEADPRIHFALNCGARSCPPIRIYTDAVDSELDGASRAYLAAETELDPESGAVTLPGLMKLYRADFGGRDGVLAFAIGHLPEETSAAVRRSGPERVRYSRFDWGMEKPAVLA
jgi:uncharacterized protein DUF547